RSQTARPASKRQSSKPGAPGRSRCPAGACSEWRQFRASWGVLMVSLAGAVEFEKVLVGRGQFPLSGGEGQRLRLLRGVDGFGKVSSLRVSSRQSSDQDRLFMLGELASFRGELDRFGSAAKFVLLTSGQQPGQVIEGGN